MEDKSGQLLAVTMGYLPIEKDKEIHYELHYSLCEYDHYSKE